MKRRGSDKEICGGLRCTVLIQNRDVRAHSSCNAQNAVSGFIDSDVSDEYLGIRYQAGCRDKIGRRGYVAGDSDLFRGPELSGRSDGNAVACKFAAVIGKICDSGRMTEGCQHFFRVITGNCRFQNGSISFGIKTCTEDGGFHLGGSHTGFPGDPMERLSGNFQRSTVIVVHADNVCTHLLQRLHNTFHGPAVYRFISCDVAGKMLRRQNSAHDAGCGSAVLRVQSDRRMGRIETVKTRPVDDELSRLRKIPFNINAKP